MKCIRPRYITYRDVAGIEHRQEIPCNKCIACLHNQQDSWSIRLRETNAAHESFIYDTLTLSPAGISYRNITDKVTEKFSQMHQDKVLGRLLDRYRCVDEESGEIMYLAPYVDRSILQNWLKRGRENFYNDHGYRLKIKYFIVLENGPKTSRPHFHLLMWGISHGDYVRYFAKPWRRSMGYTKTKFIFKGTDKDRECIARYLSKYVSKGVFESPLVLCGLIPKPYRSISNGIGEEYLQRSCFEWFRSDFAAYLRKHSVDLSYRSDESAFRSEIRDFIASDKYARILPALQAHFDKCKTRLTTYYDSNGYPHALPRYYRHRLVNSKTPNVLSFALQNYLLESSRVYTNKQIQEYAHEQGFLIADKDPKHPFAGFDKQLYNLLYIGYNAAQKLRAETEAKGRFIKLKNHYGRAMNLTASLAN